MQIEMCSLFSGSTGNCIYLNMGGTHLLVDAGLPARNILLSLQNIGISVQDISAILVTHEHSDHIRGLGALARKLRVPVYANSATWAAMEAKVGMLDLANIRMFSTNEDFYIGDVGVDPFSIPHDAADPVGFCFHCRNRKASILTDLGHTNDTILEKVAHSDIMALEANHDEAMLRRGPYPARLKQRILGRRGHLSNAAAAEALVELVGTGLQGVLLSHLSQENNVPETAFHTVVETLSAAGIQEGRDVRVEVAPPRNMSQVFMIS
ncbi:MBL fold metallo-hydrolase [Christensenellaceae bacterium NSJ-53]|uniref:MBL fold metallo-hydrolase n=2 Tax=Gehongia tenuis TaxID=2763655 RepID=A0A926D808_9FIRM|nr:MBL fold metallo-hydrolase [Gehongia tenuis]